MDLYNLSNVNQVSGGFDETTVKFFSHVLHKFENNINYYFHRYPIILLKIVAFERVYAC